MSTTGITIVDFGNAQMGDLVKIRATADNLDTDWNYVRISVVGQGYWRDIDLNNYVTDISFTLPDFSYNVESYTLTIEGWSVSITRKVYLPPAPNVSGISNIRIGGSAYFEVQNIARGFECDVSLVVGSTTFDICSFGFNDCEEEELLFPSDGSIDLARLRYYSNRRVYDYDICKAFPTLKEKTAKFVCKTYIQSKNSKKLIGTQEKQVNLVVPENDITKPAIDSIKFSPITSCTDALAPLYIRGKTGLNANISATSAYSDIAEYEVTAGSVGAKGNPGIIDVLANDGNIPVTVKVTDARGFSRTVTENIYVYPYSRPKIVPYSGYSDIVCERAKATGELHSDGTYLAIMAGKRFTSIVKDGVELNSCRLRYRYKPTTLETFGDWVTLLADGSAESEIQVLAGNVVSNTSASYDIELSVIDAVGGEHTIRFPVMTSAISFVLYDGVDGAAFGKYPEEPHVVDIASHMTLRVRGRLEVLGASWASLGLADGMEESPYAYGRQDDTGCYYQVSNGNHVQVAFNCSYNYAGRSKVINLTPIPEEYRPERTVCSICPTNDRRLALVTVQPDGYIRIEWVQTIASTSNTSSATVLWVDGYLDYWV